MFESKAGIFLIAGVFFFALAFVSNALVPVFMYQHLPEEQIPDLVNPNLRFQFEDMSRRYPDSFVAAFGKPPKDDEKWWNDKCGEALQQGHDIYIAEGCWHCHSQFIRPVSNEEVRWGSVSSSPEYQNVLNRPVLWGTRRVGPDLIREGGRRGNDWHAVHLFEPERLSQDSPMPSYPWFFDGSPDKPTKRGFAVLTYIQWLGSWLPEYPYYEDYKPSGIKEILMIPPSKKEKEKEDDE